MEKVPQRLDMDNTKAMSIPLAQHFKLLTAISPITNGGMVKMLKFPYAQVDVCLLYSIVCTWLDNAFVVH